MTELDEKLLEFKKLLNLNLCGNYFESLDAGVIPRTVRSLELQTNRIKSIHAFAEDLPQELLYLGLARNLLSNGNHVISSLAARDFARVFNRHRYLVYF